MTKAEVANKVAEKTGLSRKETVEAMEVFLDCIKASLKDESKVSLVGFGTFYVKRKNARNGRNPRTGERIRIPEKLVATFKPGKSFREMVNGGQDVSPEPDAE
jgi:DNA-binding protein HU-beta